MRAFMFDLYGTLSNSVPIILRTSRLACKELGIEVSDEVLQHQIGLPMTLTGEMFLGPGRAQEYIDCYYRHYDPSDLTAFPGVPEMLADLKQAGFTLALVTSRRQDSTFDSLRRIGIADMFELMRTRYEGTERCPDEKGLQDVRVIGTTKQATCHVLSLDPRLPENTRATMWACLAQAEHSVFLPVNAAVKRSAHGYEFDHKDRSFLFNPALPGVAFRRLCTLAEENRQWYGKGVRAFWRAEEERFLREYPALVAAGDAERITAYTVAAEAKALVDARRIFDELMAYAAANNRIRGDGSGATEKPSAPFAPRATAHRTKVLFFFDTEDFTCDESNDTIRDIANILHEEGARGQFAMVGQLGPFLT